MLNKCIVKHVAMKQQTIFIPRKVSHMKQVMFIARQKHQDAERFDGGMPERGRWVDIINYNNTLPQQKGVGSEGLRL